MSRFKIAVAGFMHESNTFNPLYADRGAFAAQGLCFGDSLLAEWADSHHEMGGFITEVKKLENELLPLVMAWATPSGPVKDAVFEEIVGSIISSLKKNKPDALLLALHGAMVTESYLDADGETLFRIRQAMGLDFPIVVTLDFHGNVSQRLIDNCDITLAYQTCPHVDQFDCGSKAGSLLQKMLEGEINPRQALAKPPMIINIMVHDTSKDPLRSFITKAKEFERESREVLSVSLMAGFPYADVPQMGPSVIVVTDGQSQRAQREATRFADELWQNRAAMKADLPNAAKAVSRALQAEMKTPVVLVDTGDNVGGGSAGDGTVILAELIRQQAWRSVVCLYAPDEVQQCIAMKDGQDITLRVGGKVDQRHGDPVEVTGKVRLIHNGVYTEPEIRHGGKRINNMGLTALLELDKGNLLVLNSLRHPPFSLGQITSLGIDPKSMQILVVKAAIAYKAAYAPVAETIIEVDTPGLSAVNPHRFDYQNICRPMFPLNE